MHLQLNRHHQIIQQLSDIKSTDNSLIKHYRLFIIRLCLSCTAGLTAQLFTQVFDQTLMTFVFSAVIYSYEYVVSVQYYPAYRLKYSCF